MIHGSNWRVGWIFEGTCEARQSQTPHYFIYSTIFSLQNIKPITPNAREAWPNPRSSSGRTDLSGISSWDNDASKMCILDMDIDLIC